MGGLPVDFHDFIPADQPAADGRGVLVGFIDDYVSFRVGFVDNGPDAPIDPADHHFEVLLLLFGVRVQPFEHGVNPKPLDAADREGIDV